MKCSCGERYDLLNTRLVVDVIEKDYYCLSCEQRMSLRKDKFGNFTETIYDGTRPTVTKWKIDGT